MGIEASASACAGRALAQGVIGQADRIWAYNTVIAALAGLDGTSEPCEGALMQALADPPVPKPSDVNRRFDELCRDDPVRATNWFYDLCRESGYIRSGDGARKIAWTSPTAWGPLEMTINLAKPEKDPHDIARAAQGADKAEDPYPACRLCMENEGYAGRSAGDSAGFYPDRRNLRIIQLALGGESWGFQYSPYSYYDEHCIVMSRQHRPMKIDRHTLSWLLDFVDLLPHYFIGSNADLPIVGGSILCHDHFQGGRHTFALDRAPIVRSIELPGFADVEAGIVKWPVSVIRMASCDRERLLDAAWKIASVWKRYDDARANILSHGGGADHNTVTPIVHKADGVYTMDIALRCNVATAENPLGVFHPHSELHHIKKENIGLIEVMGLAVLPARLSVELAAVAKGLLAGEDLEAEQLTAKHAVWAREVMRRHPEFCEDNSTEILGLEVAQVFAAVLEHSGVFKWDAAGRAAFARFLDAFE